MINYNIVNLFILGFLILLFNSSFSTILVHENFDDQSYTSPLEIKHIFGGQWFYDRNNNHGANGFSIRGDHSQGDLIAILKNLSFYLDKGIYFRYWVKYSENYLFPGDLGTFENLKMFKIAGGNANIEFIYKQTGSGGPHKLQLYWVRESTGEASGGTGNSEVDLFQGNNRDFIGNKFLTKNVWHKIEIYIKISNDGTNDGSSIVHVQVDDSDVYINNDADIMLPASIYNDANQFISIRANVSPPPGHGFWFIDDITVVYNEGDLSNNEPPEPSNVHKPKTPQRIIIEK